MRTGCGKTRRAIFHCVPGKKMGIYVYVLFLEEGSEEKILPILEQCPDCAFLVFLEGAGFQRIF